MFDPRRPKDKGKPSWMFVHCRPKSKTRISRQAVNGHSRRRDKKCAGRQNIHSYFVQSQELFAPVLCKQGVYSAIFCESIRRSDSDRIEKVTEGVGNACVSASGQSCGSKKPMRGKHRLFLKFRSLFLAAGAFYVISNRCFCRVCSQDPLNYPA